MLGYIDERIADQIGAGDLREVRLSRRSLSHIKIKHPELEDIELDMLPDIVNRGRVIKDRINGSANIVWASSPKTRGYTTAIKVTKRGLDCVTFYRSRKNSVKTLEKRGETLRFQQ